MPYEKHGLDPRDSTYSSLAHKLLVFRLRTADFANKLPQEGKKNFRDLRKTLEKLTTAFEDEPLAYRELSVSARTKARDLLKTDKAALRTLQTWAIAERTKRIMREKGDIFPYLFEGEERPGTRA